MEEIGKSVCARSPRYKVKHQPTIHRDTTVSWWWHEEIDFKAPRPRYWRRTFPEGVLDKVLQGFTQRELYRYSRAMRIRDIALRQLSLPFKEGT